ncbi:hypothetical protein ACVBEQ_07225 [Nakamurella sp. GG22]
MTTSTDRIQDVLAAPDSNTIRVLQEQGLLPVSTTERVWTREDAQQQPAVGLLAVIDPKHTFAAGKMSLSVSNPDSFYTNDVGGDVVLRSRVGTFTSLFLAFNGLGSNRKLLAWFDVRVFGPGSTSLTIGGTGNPSTTVVTNQATGGQRVTIPFGMTATSDGRAYAYVVPTLTGHAGSWYGTSVYGF